MNIIHGMDTLPRLVDDALVARLSVMPVPTQIWSKILEISQK